MLAAVLLLGNLKFKSSRKDQAQLASDDTAASQICNLLGLSTSEFIQAFLHPKLKAGQQTAKKDQTVEEVNITIIFYY